MPESKEFPKIKNLHGGIVVPYNAKQKIRINENDVEEAFYVFQRVKLNQVVKPNLQQSKKCVWQQLQSDLHSHIYPKYDQGSQSTLQAYAQRAERQGRSDIVAECDKIMDWLDSCLSYYYDKKEAIYAVVDEAALVGVAWDFETDVPLPGDVLSLKAIRGMFG